MVCYDGLGVSHDNLGSAGEAMLRYLPKRFRNVAGHDLRIRERISDVDCRRTGPAADLERPEPPFSRRRFNSSKQMWREIR